MTIIYNNYSLNGSIADEERVSIVSSKKSAIVNGSESFISENKALIEEFNHQIRTLQGENEKLVKELTQGQPRQHSLSFKPMPSFNFKLNDKKYSELLSLREQLNYLDSFCEETLSDISEGIKGAEFSIKDLLAQLRSKSNLTTEQQKQIQLIEEAKQSLTSLENLFQKTQKNAISRSPSSASVEQEKTIQVLIEKIEMLREENSLLKQCRQGQLKDGLVYDKELAVLLRAIESEQEQLSQTTIDLQKKVEGAYPFIRELANHLLDYTEKFDKCSNGLIAMEALANANKKIEEALSNLVKLASTYKI